MSAYGPLSPLTGHREPIASRIFRLRPKDSNDTCVSWTHLSTHHLTLSTAPPDLVETLYAEFAAELGRDDGRTYPQEPPMSRSEFKAYFFARDVIVGIGEERAGDDDADGGDVLEGERGVDALLAAKGGRNWADVVAGFYYIKPNYPGHSAHICNAGFVIPYARRGLRLGSLLGGTFEWYACGLGYRGSIFNLVYADNPASLRIWDGLGFQRVGIVPGAGKRVRKIQDSNGGVTEEVYYVDAHVVFKSFVAN